VQDLQRKASFVEIAPPGVANLVPDEDPDELQEDEDGDVVILGEIVGRR
jgi:hypothetical protein